MNKPDLLTNLAAAESETSCFIIAATINLYIESLRRTKGTVLLSVSDIPALYGIIDTLLNPVPKAPIEFGKSATRSRALTEEEQGRLLKAVSQEVVEERR